VTVYKDLPCFMLYLQYPLSLVECCIIESCLASQVHGQSGAMSSCVLLVCWKLLFPEPPELSTSVTANFASNGLGTTVTWLSCFLHGLCQIPSSLPLPQYKHQQKCRIKT